VKIVFHSTHERSFQAVVGEILVRQFCTNEENKKAISKILEDSQIVSKFLSAFEDDSNSIPSSSSNHSLDLIDKNKEKDSHDEGHKENFEENHKETSKEFSREASKEIYKDSRPIEAFLSWYHSNDPEVKLQRNAIEQRIDRLFLPLSTKFLQFQQKVIFLILFYLFYL